MKKQTLLSYNNKRKIQIQISLQEKELRWLLEEQVKKDLAEIQNTLMVRKTPCHTECSLLTT